ncbi:hypothetical protein E1258_28185 [Micromonospora sp. KC207]|nr:hypothetical protein E1258_28185 [Micromonospora sp. KC207]
MSAGSCSTGKPRHSFDPATLVLLADGTARPIGDVQPGDEVVSTDPETGETSAEPVTRLHVNIDRELTNVTVLGSGAQRAVTLETTAHHPFWDATDRQWVDAGKLQVGHRLLIHDDKRLEGDGTGAGAGGGGPGREVTVVAVDNFTGSELMRDLTVATHHTYYVLAGTTPVLVHNCGESIYEAGGKHGPTARGSSRGTNSAESRNGQGALENSIEWTPEGPGQSPRRIGVSDGEIVILDRTRQAACGCSRDGGMNDIWHGHVRGWGELSQGMQSAIRKAGLVDRKGRPL